MIIVVSVSVWITSDVNKTKLLRPTSRPK